MTTVLPLTFLAGALTARTSSETSATERTSTTGGLRVGRILDDDRRAETCESQPGEAPGNGLSGSSLPRSLRYRSLRFGRVMGRVVLSSRNNRTTISRRHQAAAAVPSLFRDAAIALRQPRGPAGVQRQKKCLVGRSKARSAAPQFGLLTAAAAADRETSGARVTVIVVPTPSLQNTATAVRNPVQLRVQRLMLRLGNIALARRLQPIPLLLVADKPVPSRFRLTGLGAHLFGTCGFFSGRGEKAST